MKNKITILTAIIILAVTACTKFKPQNNKLKNNNLRIVMLGDSETRRINHYWGADTNWNTLTGYDSIFNYGYDAYNSGDILSGPVYDAMDKNPDVIFLMIGINDAHHNISPTTTLTNIQSLIDTTRKKNIDLVIQSVIPTTNYYDTLYGGFPTNGILAQRAAYLNGQILLKCLNEGVPFLDVRSGMTYNVGGKGSVSYLRNDRSIDGIHINYAGYEVWKNHLVNYINNNY